MAETVLFIQSLFKYFLLLTVLALTMACGALVCVYHQYDIDFNTLTTYNTGKPSILLDQDGQEWARFQLDWRDPIKLKDVPQHLIDAFIAAEDWAFFSHNGISIKGIVRSTLVNIWRGYKAQGASTITQQLVRLLFFDTSKTFSRKIKEQFMAIIVEKNYTKQQILETYLNHVYFGCGIYGVEAAAQRFWGKSVRDVTIDQAAVLAGIMRSPARYNPLLRPLSSQQRRNNILALMHKLTFIDKQTYDQAIATELVTHKAQATSVAPHLQEHIRVLLEERFGKKMLYTGGLTIQTTLNKKIQDAAQQAFNSQCAHLKKTIHPSIDGGVITIDSSCGAIRALVGGYDFKTSKWNRALQARRQMGSTFKPLIYACAVQQGMNFSDTCLDEPITAGSWSPGNYNGEFEGEMTLARALSRSNNIIAIKTLAHVGYDPVIKLARKCGITAQLNHFPSLALGCVDSTVKEVVGMFNVFANNGIYVEPYALVWVKDRLGQKIWRHTQEKMQVLAPIVCSHLTKVLEIGINRIKPAIPGPWIDSAIISKTGTTNDWRTCWFVGATPDYTTALYIGRDDNKPLGVNVWPLKTAFPIWLEVHRILPITRKLFTHSNALRLAYINEWTGKKIDERDDQALPIFVNQT